MNEKTSWIDASFLYSTQEPWVAALRSWKNGTLAEGPMFGYPPLNGPHIPLINPAPPQIHRLMNPERLFSKLKMTYLKLRKLIVNFFFVFYLFFFFL